VDQEVLGGPQHQVLGSVTRLWSKASPGASCSYRANMSCFTFYACDVLCITYRILWVDGDMLHGSTLPYVILVADVFMFID
jgi:hypothetical protein